MPPCADPNCCELASLGPPSPSLIDNAERLLRGAYEPTHYKNTSIKSSFARYGDIFDSMLSVWRYDKGPAGNPVMGRALVQNHGPQAPMVLKDCVILEVGWLRGLTTEAGDRAFCVFDDTVIDDQGNTHPDHAGIGLCKLLDKDDFKPGSDNALHLQGAIAAYANSRRETGDVIPAP